MTLGERQRLFFKLFPRLADFIYLKGLQATWGEAYRTPEQAQLNETLGTGIKNSLHCDRLAVDINLFRWTGEGWEYLTSITEEYKQIGAYWRQLHPDCRWGGDFEKRPDPNHFSFSAGDDRA